MRHGLEFVIVCTGRGAHEKIELRRLMRVSESTPGLSEWKEWGMAGERSSGSPARADRQHKISDPVQGEGMWRPWRVKQVKIAHAAQQGDDSKPWTFPCPKCTPRGRTVEDFQYSITDENLGKIVLGALAQNIDEFDISHWRR
jgi:hypothetical protein